MQAVLFTQGLELFIYGMGSVVLFLGLLVYATRCMSWLILRFFPEPVAAVSINTPRLKQAHAPGTTPERAAQSQAVDPQVLAAIGAAVARHRGRRAANTQPAPLTPK